ACRPGARDSDLDPNADSTSTVTGTSDPFATRAVRTVRPTTHRAPVSTVTSSSGTPVPPSAAATCHSRMPTEPPPLPVPHDSATTRRARAVTGAKATRPKPSLRRPYSAPSATVTSRHVSPSRYCSTHERGGITPALPESAVSRNHHTPISSTVTSKAQSSRAHCWPTCGQVPHCRPYLAALSSHSAFVPSLRPSTDSQ